MTYDMNEPLHARMNLYPPNESPQRGHFKQGLGWSRPVLSRGIPSQFRGSPGGPFPPLSRTEVPTCFPLGREALREYPGDERGGSFQEVTPFTPKVRPC